MRKFVKRMAFLVIVCLMSCSCVFAEEMSVPEGETNVDEYVSVDYVSDYLTKSGDKALCTVKLYEKTSLSSVRGTFHLMNVNGKKVATHTAALKDKGSVFLYQHTFNISKSGKYCVKYTIKTYKAGKLKDTVTGKTNSVE